MTTTSISPTLPATEPTERLRAAMPVAVRSALLAVLTTMTGAVIAYLLAAGLWFIALALLAAIPGFVLLHRVPIAAVAIWLLIGPFVTDIGGGIRMIYWAIHRGLPVAVLGILVSSGLLGIRSRRLSRLGVPELMMASYVAITALSIVYTSDEAFASLYEMYDRVFVPMCLYLIVRLLRPSTDELRWAVPIISFVLLSQTAIGILSWVAPGPLPDEWLTRVGERTTGSVISPSVFGVTTIAAGMLALHAAAYQPSRWLRVGLRGLSLLAFTMAVFTFTRAVWIAVLVAVVVVAFVHRKQVAQLALVVVPLVALLIATGALSGQLSTLEGRWSNENTALDRLPVVYASLRMFEEKPVTGWGYGNFEKFDGEFQRPVNNFVPEIDHASHNLYLTILAEQGFLGAALFVGPVIWWFLASIAAYAALPRSGFSSRKLLVLLWAILAGHVVVNNFSNMGSVFGLGQWWLVLGLVASLVSAQPNNHAVISNDESVRAGIGA